MKNTTELLKSMVSEKPIEIVKNAVRNNPIKSKAVIGDSGLINFYHGSGEGIAFVDTINNEVLAFLYYDEFEGLAEGFCNDIPELHNSTVRDCEFSCTEICFLN